MNKLTFLSRVASLDLVRQMYHSNKICHHLVTRLIGDLTVSFEGLVFSGSIGQRHFLQSLLNREFERYTLELFKESVKSGMIVCDVGAHLGLYTLLAAQRVGPKGRVLAFEPDPRNFAFLVRNVRRNHLENTVIPVPKALAAKTGVEEFFLQANGDGSRSSFYGDNIAGVSQKTSINVSTLDDFLLQLGGLAAIDVVKIDVEGAEVHVLEGMKRIVSNVCVMIVECNPDALAMANSSAEQLIHIIDHFGFCIKLVNEKQYCFEPINLNIVQGIKKVNLYCYRDG